MAAYLMSFDLTFNTCTSSVPTLRVHGGGCVGRPCVGTAALAIPERGNRQPLAVSAQRAGGIMGSVRNVQFMGLFFPQRFFLPMIGEAHSLCDASWLVVKQCDNFALETAVRTDALFQIRQIAKLGI